MVDLIVYVTDKAEKDRLFDKWSDFLGAHFPNGGFGNRQHRRQECLLCFFCVKITSALDFFEISIIIYLLERML